MKTITTRPEVDATPAAAEVGAARKEALAWRELESLAKAKARMSAGRLSREAAFLEVVEECPDLYSRFLRESCFGRR